MRNKFNVIISAIICLTVVTFCTNSLHAQGVHYNRDLSPAEGLTKPQEKPFRDEICLNGKWDFQPVDVPKSWVAGQGIAPELGPPDPGKWETTKIKIPSPWNVNEWGGGAKTGKGTNLPYAPSSVYFPSYPEKWARARMGWLKRNFTIPATWHGKRLILHFEAVAGDCLVMVNGKEVGTNMDAYLPFDIDITNVANVKGDNELLVGIRHRKLFDKTNAQYAKMSATYPPGSNTNDLIGIWQDVFLQAVPPVHVEAVFAKPFVEKDELQVEVKITNQTGQKRTVKVDADVKEWINDATTDIPTAAEIKWHLGNSALKIPAISVVLDPGETQTVNLVTKVASRLKLWDPDHPNLYTIVLNTSENGTVLDRKTERFGWRSFTIKDKSFLLNGQKIQCYGDLQHPFSAYIMSRRFAWAWYKMIKDLGGNAVRPHAQPWPRVYYDLADEMGIMVLDEDALFGSSIALNLEEDITWKRTANEIERLILRDRNHPSVVGWSVGNEIFAIALLNKPTADVARKWDDKIVELAKIPAALDPTRAFITCDGDKDMNGNLPVWSKHFGLGNKLDMIPDINKPLVVGESGGTYYAKPRELFQFVGVKAYGTYHDRSEALAIDVYQNVVKMARPLLSYFSPSEVCWFGIEHMNLGYHDYARLPDEHDGIFPTKPYEEGKPGYQYERIPPYVTTFNPGLDPLLPLYKPLPMFEALKASLVKGAPAASPWDHSQDTSSHKAPYPKATYDKAVFIGKTDGTLMKLLTGIGVNFTSDKDQAKLVIIDGENVSAAEMEQARPIIDVVRSTGGLIWVVVGANHPSKALATLLPAGIKFTTFKTSAMQPVDANVTAAVFDLRDLYFSEMNPDRYIIKQVIESDLLKDNSVLEPAKNDWALFNAAPENIKCAQEVLYEHLQRPASSALLILPAQNGKLAVSTIDYNIINRATATFWRKLCMSMAISLSGPRPILDNANNKGHDLLMDGPPN